MYEAACRYKELGCEVIPLRRDTNTPAIRYKSIVRNGGFSATELRTHFADDRHNIGLLTGSASRGLMAIDLDNYAAYRDFEKRHRNLAKCLPYAISPRGWHFYFLGVEGQRDTHSYRVGNSERSPVHHIKGDGNYITLDPSWREPTPKKPHQRREYRWVRPLPDLSQLPTIHPHDLLPKALLGTGGAISSYQYDASGGVALSMWLAARAAAVRYQPLGRRTRGRALFAFVRYLRGLFGDAVTVNQLSNVFADWHARIQSKAYVEDKSYQSNWRQFCFAWEHVRLNNRQALARLIAAYDPAPEASAAERVWHLCQVLGAWNKGRFYLAGETAAGIVGCSQPYASKCLRELVKEDRLEISKGCDRWRRKAKTYQLVLGGQHD